MDRLMKLKELEMRLLEAMDAADYRAFPAIARQYRETLKDIEEIEGAGNDGDEIGEILAERSADGKPGAVRKNKSGI